MSMNTPTGQIKYLTKHIKSFDDMEQMDNEQYLLGISDFQRGVGGKITLSNLLASTVSIDSDNLLQVGEDNKLFAEDKSGNLNELETSSKDNLVDAINELNRIIGGGGAVKGIVATYADLEEYDTSTLVDGNIIQVLQDETHDGSTTFYKWIANTSSFEFIGEASGGNGGANLPLLTFQWSDHLFNDIQWLRADTFSWHSGEIYKAVYDELVEEYDNEDSEFTVEENSANFDKIGLPVIDNGFAGSFTGNNYLRLQNKIPFSAANSWEIKLKIRTGNDISTFQGILGYEAAFPFEICISNSKLQYSLSSNNTSWNLQNSILGSNTLSANTDYYLKYSFNGSQYHCEISTDDLTYISDYTYNSSTKVYETSAMPTLGKRSSGTMFYGSIDLKENYIKINNEYWWKPYSITYKRTPKDYKIVDASQEFAVFEKYKKDGLAWYYILDTENQMFKLPRTKWGFKGLRTNVGIDIDEKLPNITGKTQLFYTYGNGGDGAFEYINVTGGGVTTGTASSTGCTSARFNASRSSSTYQDNAPVQERATQMYLYFYVGDYKQSAIQQTAGLNTELFNGKLDLNAYNLNAQGKEYISGLGKPNSNYIELSTSAANQTVYVAPADGYMTAVGRGNANGWVYLGLQAPDGTPLKIMSRCISSASNMPLNCFIPVRKGYKVYMDYQNASAAIGVIFTYAEGSYN